ncbi:hypothetical protein DRO26_02215 [Candidatus Bathyarchaeota archaeon]|nr:MAG: hypothetical protein DRO26_02215 [Candidatus Bathyarchaeota archaeon]
MTTPPPKGIKTLAIWIVVILIVAAVAGVGGYYIGHSIGYDEGYKKGYETAKPAGPVLPEKIKIGSLMALSGFLGPMGQKIKLGVELAVKEINEHGGINGRPVELIMEDTGTNPTQALEAFKKLVEVDGVQVVIGPMASGEVMAIGDYANERHVVVISPSATSPEITTKFPDDYLFRTVGSDALQGKALAEIMLEKGFNKIAILVLNNAYGIGIEEKAKEVLGDKVILTIRYDPTKMDFRTELDQIKNSGADAVLYVGYYEDGRVMFRQALEMGLDNIQWVAAEGVYGESMFEVEEAAEFMSRAVMGTRPIAPTGIRGYQVFSEAFQKEFGEPPSMYADTAYDATMLAALAIAYAGEYNGTKIKDALTYVSQFYVGATGEKVFDKNGDQLTQFYEIWKVEKVNGEYKFVAIGTWPKTL